MTVYIRKGLPCLATLKAGGIDASDEIPAGLSPVRILLLNLMPRKEEAEMDYYRALSHASHPVEVIPVKVTGQTYHHTPQEYVDTYYTDIHDLGDELYDGLIITGAPVEKLPFEEVRYWDQLLWLYRWAQTHVRSSLHICWGAQAALYALYGLDKSLLSRKIFGIYELESTSPDCPLMDGMGDRFYMPHSRFTEVRPCDIMGQSGLTVLASADEVGPSILMAGEGRDVFVTGHLEYSAGRINYEYRRDLSFGLDIDLPCNYYCNDDPDGGFVDCWRGAANRFYANWVDHYVAP